MCRGCVGCLLFWLWDVFRCFFFGLPFFSFFLCFVVVFCVSVCFFYFFFFFVFFFFVFGFFFFFFFFFFERDNPNPERMASAGRFGRNAPPFRCTVQCRIARPTKHAAPIHWQSGTEQSGKAQYSAAMQLKGTHPKVCGGEVFDREHNDFGAPAVLRLVTSPFLPPSFESRRRVQSRRSPKYQCPPITEHREHDNHGEDFSILCETYTMETPWDLSRAITSTGARPRRGERTVGQSSGECGIMLRTAQWDQLMLGDGQFATIAACRCGVRPNQKRPKELLIACGLQESF